MHQRAVKWIEDSELEADTSERKKLLGMAMEELERSDLNDANGLYALGYAWYVWPDDTSERLENAKRYLNKALALNPGHRFASLYLGHLLFDEGNYEAARQQLTGFGEHEFEEKFDQAWRDAKIAELLLVVSIRLGDVTSIRTLVARLCDVLSHLDAGMNPYPEELIQALSENLCTR